MPDAIAAMAESLRGQIIERVKAQQQLVLVSAAVAGATLSLASELLSDHPEIMALLCLLYVGISLALLRHDQEITIIAALLLDDEAFGPHAQAQAVWEAHKFTQMQKGIPALIKSGAQTAGNYGVPTLAVIATFSATVIGAEPQCCGGARLRSWFLRSVRRRRRRCLSALQASRGNGAATTCTAARVGRRN